MRLNLITVHKVLKYASENGPQKKTNLSTYTKMNYDRFNKLQKVLVGAKLMVIEELDSGKYLKITNNGREFLLYLSANLPEVPL